MLLDHVIMTFVIMIVVTPGVAYDIFQNLGGNAPPKLMLGNYYWNIVGFSLYFNKDILFGQSPAKRILKLQVVNAKTGEPASSLRCLVRNITVVLWPIEVVTALINNERRVGDFIAGTKLTTYATAQPKQQLNWVYLITALVVGTLATYLIMFLPVELLLRSAGLPTGI